MADTTNSNLSVVVPPLNGRATLCTPYAEVNKGNIIDVLRDILPLYITNKTAIIYLQNYRRGVQPIIYRTKKVRKDILNTIVKNIADQIVNFKTGYLLGEPIQFVGRDKAQDQNILDTINELNNFCYENKKNNLDKELAESMYTCGVGYRLVLPNSEFKKDPKLPPFVLNTLNPATTGVVYYSGIGNKPVLSFTEILVKADNGDLVSEYCCYTEKEYFVIINDTIIKSSKNPLGAIPIIEYPLNSNKIGGFEVVIPLLDAINTIESNRVDAIEQTVQSIMVFYNLGMNTESMQKLEEFGAISVSSNAKTGTQQDIKFLDCNLNQQQTQTLINSLEQDVLNICGMPNRNGGSSTSDTGSAVIMRDGWSDAEARAKQDELTFKASEIDALRLMLKIWFVSKKEEQTLVVSNIDIRFTRRNYENVGEKTTVLTQMLGSDWIAPIEAFKTCGLFNDPQLAYEQSLEYHNSIIDTQKVVQPTTVVDENITETTTTN